MKHYRPYAYQEDKIIIKPEESLMIDKKEHGDYLLYVITILDMDDDKNVLYYGLIFNKAQGEYIYQTKQYIAPILASNDMECVLTSGGYND